MCTILWWPLLSSKINWLLHSKIEVIFFLWNVTWTDHLIFISNFLCFQVFVRCNYATKKLHSSRDRKEQKNKLNNFIAYPLKIATALIVLNKYGANNSPILSTIIKFSFPFQFEVSFDIFWFSNGTRSVYFCNFLNAWYPFERALTRY